MRWQGPTAARTVSPDHIVFRNNPTTPIRNFNASPISVQTTPIHIPDRKSLEKHQVHCNQQLINKLGNSEMPYGVHLPFNYVQTTQQKVIHILSEQANSNIYPAFRTIHKRELTTPLNNNQLLTPTNT